MDRKTIDFPKRPRDFFPPEDRFLHEDGDGPEDETVPDDTDAPVNSFKKQNAENLAVQAGNRTPTNSAVSKSMQERAASRKQAERDLCRFTNEIIKSMEAASSRFTQEETAWDGQVGGDGEKSAYLDAVREEWESFTENVGDFTEKAADAACCAFRKASAAVGDAAAPFRLALLYTSLGRQGAPQPETVRPSPQAVPYIRYDSV